MILLKDFDTREALETHIVTTFGKTTDPKEEVIEGTVEELREFKLKHGQRIWGVVAQATDYQPKVAKNKLTRGEVKPSIINGLIKKKKKNAPNKDKDRK